MAVVLVTGSSGLIGRAVVRSLARSFQVVGFDREGWPHPPREAECVCVDLTSNESVAAGIQRVRYAYGSRIASVVHLAAYYDFSGESSPMYDEITVRGTGRLLRALQQALEVEAAGSHAIVVPTDVAHPDQVETAAATTGRELGPIVVWVNNAMVSVFSPLMQFLGCRLRQRLALRLVLAVRRTTGRPAWNQQDHRRGRATFTNRIVGTLKPMLEARSRPTARDITGQTPQPSSRPLAGS